METGKASDGMKVKRVREILRVKQSALASSLGGDWNQKKISLLEDKEEIDDQMLEEIANALKVPVDVIRNFDESTVMNIQNNYEGSNSGSLNNYGTIDYAGKWIEAIEEIKDLYERLLQSEREKVEMLNKLLEGKK